MLVDGSNVHHQFKIWDCSGLPIHAHAIPLYYRSARVIVITFDPTDPLERSFRFAQNTIFDLKDPTRPTRSNLTIALVATKMDVWHGRPQTTTSPVKPGARSRATDSPLLVAAPFGASSAVLPDQLMLALSSSSPVLARAKAFADFNDVLFFECSITEPIGIFRMFNRIAKANQQILELEGFEQAFGALYPPRAANSPILEATYILSRIPLRPA
ncbi:MAG: hypothetical protein K2Q09_05395 [Phycisphaerales bacterium]|nr:hypothetical protein [Phycisphaerales bacterium]